MFYCPSCGGAVETTAISHFCIVCEWFEPRSCVDLDLVDDGLSYPAANTFPEYTAA